MKDIPLLEVKDLTVSFTQYAKGLKQKKLTVISGLDLSIKSGEVIAVVGSSGSGKSLLAHAILGILPKNATVTGSIFFSGEELSKKRKKELRGRRIALVPQSVNFLDPLMRVGSQVCTGINQSTSATLSANTKHLADRIDFEQVESGSKSSSKKRVSRAELKARAKLLQRKIFERYKLSIEDERLYPFQLSGGMARRVLVSGALTSRAELIIADEPTPGLHPAVVEETLKHLKELADEGRSILLITHDIATALTIADKIAVFYAGTTVEVAPSSDFGSDNEPLRHPYSEALWNALPQNNFKPIAGSQPPLSKLPEGCLFEPRCDKSTPECRKEKPITRDLRGGTVRCINAS